MHFRKCGGTVQADILKKIKRKTCIFSTEFSLKLMGDVQYFVQHKVRNFYSVSISGYHIYQRQVLTQYRN